MKITVILYILLFTLPAWAGTWRDDFEDGNLAGYEEIVWAQPTNWYVENGQLVCDVKGDAFSYLALPDIVVDDVTIELDGVIELIHSNIATIELVMRVKDIDHFVNFAVGFWSNGFKVDGINSSSFLFDQTFSFPLNKGG